MEESRRIVVSTAGKDKGEYLVCVGEQELRLLVCDGKRRPLRRPKLKNPRHLKFMDDSLPKEGIETNRALRRALSEYRRKREQSAL